MKNAYQDRLLEDLSTIVKEYVDDVSEDSALIDELADFVSRETRRSYINGLRASQKAKPTGKRA